MADFVDSDSLLNFCEITGADPDIAKSYLTVSEGSVERGISLFMENGGHPLEGSSLGGVEGVGIGGSSSAGGSSPTGSGFPAPRQAADDVRAPIAPKRETLLGNDGPSFIRSGPRRLPASVPQSPFTQEPLAPVVPSIGNDRNSRLAELFRPPTAIIQDVNNLEQARELAKSQSKWVIVTLNDPSEFPCQMMNRDLWKDSAVQDLIRESFIFVYWVADSSPGRHHRNLYPVDTYPYAAVIDPVTGERVKIWSSVMTPAEFMQDALEFLGRNSLFNASHASPARKKKRVEVESSAKGKSVTELTEDEQLEMALAASMGDGSGSTNQSRSKEVIYVDDEDEGVTEMEEETSVWTQIEPKLNTEPPTGSTDGTRIQFRLPDGSRKIRTFFKTDPVRTLFQYVKADVPDCSQNPFELMSFKDSLEGRMEETVAQAGLGGASITVVMS
ncbi:thioredoxin-like protein [Phlyctochytrium arcticum]|nr:thioredoxin-like protein [Phlyctochytrium arcticum]